MVNLYKLANTQARNANYEQILRILNDSLQGTAARLGFLFGGTPDFLLDTRRGLYSYPALQSRLAENTLRRATAWSTTPGPVLRLAQPHARGLLRPADKLRHVYAGGDPAAYLVPDEALTAFMEHCAARIGDAYFRTPRNTIKEFLDLLAVLEQNPAPDWRSVDRHAGSTDRDARSSPRPRPPLADGTVTDDGDGHRRRRRRAQTDDDD